MDELKLWMFNCGSPANYVVEAADEVQAMAVATAWCKQRGIRPPAAIRPMVVAGPEILVSISAPPQEEVKMPADTSEPPRSLLQKLGVTS